MPYDTGYMLAEFVSRIYRSNDVPPLHCMAYCVVPFVNSALFVLPNAVNRYSVSVFKIGSPRPQLNANTADGASRINVVLAYFAHELFGFMLLAE